MVSKRGVNDSIFRKLVKREERGKQSSRFFHHVPPRLRIPVSTLVDESRQLLQCVLLGFTRSGDFLVSYSADGAFASSAPGAEGPSRARYHLQVWRFAIHEPLRLYSWAPLFRASGGGQVDMDPEGDSDDEDPELHLRESSRSHLLITLHESPDQRFLIVHGMPAEGEMGGAGGSSGSSFTPDRNCAPGGASAGTVRNYLTVLPSPSALRSGCDELWSREDGWTYSASGCIPSTVMGHMRKTHMPAAPATQAAPVIRCGHASYLTIPPQSPSLPALAFLPPDRLVLNTSSAVLVLALEFTAGARAEGADMRVCACKGFHYPHFGNDGGASLLGGLDQSPGANGLNTDSWSRPPPDPTPIANLTEVDVSVRQMGPPRCADTDGYPTRGGLALPASAAMGTKRPEELASTLRQSMLAVGASAGTAVDLRRDVARAGASPRQPAPVPRKRPFHELAHRRDSRSPADKGPPRRHTSLHEGDCFCVASPSPVDGLEDCGYDRLVLVGQSGAGVAEVSLSRAEAVALPRAQVEHANGGRLDASGTQAAATPRDDAWPPRSRFRPVHGGWGARSQATSGDRVHVDDATTARVAILPAAQAQPSGLGGAGVGIVGRATSGSGLDEYECLRGDGQDRPNRRSAALLMGTGANGGGRVCLDPLGSALTVDDGRCRDAVLDGMNQDGGNAHDQHQSGRPWEVDDRERAKGGNPWISGGVSAGPERIGRVPRKHDAYSGPLVAGMCCECKFDVEPFVMATSAPHVAGGLYRLVDYDVQVAQVCGADSSAVLVVSVVLVPRRECLLAAATTASTMTRTVPAIKPATQKVCTFAAAEDSGDANERLGAARAATNNSSRGGTAFTATMASSESSCHRAGGWHDRTGGEARIKGLSVGSSALAMPQLVEGRTGTGCTSSMGGPGWPHEGDTKMHQPAPWQTITSSHSGRLEDLLEGARSQADSAGMAGPTQPQASHELLSGGRSVVQASWLQDGTGPAAAEAKASHDPGISLTSGPACDAVPSEQGTPAAEDATVPWDLENGKSAGEGVSETHTVTYKAKAQPGQSEHAASTAAPATVPNPDFYRTSLTKIFASPEPRPRHSPAADGSSPSTLQDSRFSTVESAPTTDWVPRVFAMYLALNADQRSVHVLLEQECSLAYVTKPSVAPMGSTTPLVQAAVMRGHIAGIGANTSGATARGRECQVAVTSAQHYSTMLACSLRRKWGLPCVSSSQRLLSWSNKNVVDVGKSRRTLIHPDIPVCILGWGL